MTLGLGLLAASGACGPDAHSPNRGEKVTPGPGQIEDAAAAMATLGPLDAGAGDASPADAGAAAPSCETRSVTVGTKPLGYVASGQVCNELRQGPWKFNFIGGKRHRSGSYQDGKESGPWTFFYASGPKRAEGSFANGQRIGPWVRLHKNGQRSLEGSYLRGLRDGRWRRWHDNGQLYEDRIYRAGRREGVHHKWNPEGLLQYTRLCKDDVCKIECRARGEKACPPLTLPSPSPSPSTRAR